MNAAAVRWDRVSATHARASHPALRDLDAVVPDGELCLVAGPTGGGKSTLLRTVTGAFPHSSGGTLAGQVITLGRDTAICRPRDFADIVGTVPQRPADAFVADVVEDEIAYGMECLGARPDVMRRRVEEMLDLLGLVDVRRRALSTLSAGQQQRVALAGALATGPRLLLLDEPTSALDPPAAEEVLAAVSRLVHDLGTTVLLAEHRLERVVALADRAIFVPGGAAPMRTGLVADVLRGTAVSPPVLRLAEALDWRVPVLSVRDARRLAAADPRLAHLRLPDAPASGRPGKPALSGASPDRRLGNVVWPGAPADARRADLASPSASTPTPGRVLASVRGLVLRRGPIDALRGVDLDLHEGEVTAVMGRNGAGKTSLLVVLAGVLRASAGEVTVGGGDPARMARPDAVRRVALVPSDPGDLLLTDRVDRELALADRETGRPVGAARESLEALLPGVDLTAHPRDLSAGQRLALAVAVVLARRPPVLLLDEPTRGLDAPAKARTAAMLRLLARSGHAIALVTHDVELAAVAADRVVVLAEGEIVTDAPVRQALAASPAFAPQIAKVLPGFLTVDEVVAALGDVRPDAAVSATGLPLGPGRQVSQ